MDYLSLCGMLTPMKITGRSSSITSAFINSIIPVVPPSSASEWDHLRPLVKDKKSSGYISEIHNLVLSCGTCNQSKGNNEWKTRIVGTAKLFPKARGIKGIPARVKRLEAYENSKAPTKMNFSAVVGQAVWARHHDNLLRVQSVMRESQELAAKSMLRLQMHTKRSNPALDLASFDRWALRNEAAPRPSAQRLGITYAPRATAACAEFARQHPHPIAYPSPRRQSAAIA
jgi:hypothetical protein